MLLDAKKILERTKSIPRLESRGKVVQVRGPIIQAQIDAVAVGDLVVIKRKVKNNEAAPLYAQIIGFSDNLCFLGAFGHTTGISPGSEVVSHGGPPSIGLGTHLLGQVLDGLGSPMLGLGEDLWRSTTSEGADALSMIKDDDIEDGYLDNSPPHPLSRKPVDEVFETGIRAIDAFLTLGKGQRLAVFAEPGVGKTSLMAQIARCSNADVNVIALIGERGREVAELLRHTLSPETRSRSVIIASTSDQAPQYRVGAALTAMRIGEYFRDRGLSVLLEVDSLTRLFRAYREIGLASGELPVRQGYPPSAFAQLPTLIERAGTSSSGSITALYTVLLSAGVEEDPMVEELKSLTDGHIVLSRAIAEQGHYPAIDIRTSLSRLQNKLLTKESIASARTVRRLIARLAQDRDLILMGGNPDPELALALDMEDEIKSFLFQGSEDAYKLSDSLEALDKLARCIEYHPRSGDC